MMMKHVTVVGAGQMGVGIAHVCLESGFQLTLTDQNEAQLSKAREKIASKILNVISNLTITSSPDFTKTDLIIEAIAENLEIKKAFWGQVNPAPHTILASNTSSYSITDMAMMTCAPERFIGIHFMNPVPKMTIVEVIKGINTREDVYQDAIAFVKALSKTPVTVKDSPGFVVNRILIPMINEAAFILEGGIATAEDIDASMKGAAGHPMGPLGLGDFIGLDTCLAILNDLHARFKNDKYKPCPLFKSYVEAGHLGRKSGKGFYNY